jgi:hypothetical protein
MFFDGLMIKHSLVTYQLVVIFGKCYSLENAQKGLQVKLKIA